METTAEHHDLAKPEKTRNILLIIGLILSGVSLAAFLIPELNPEMRANDPFDSLVFFINYLVSIGFFITINIQNFMEKKWEFWKLDQRLYQISLFLFSISAFSLNHSIEVFSAFPDWLMIYLVFSYTGMLLHPFREKLPPVLQHIAWFLAGTGTAITLYFTIILLPLMLVGILGSIILGLSLHLLAPLFALIEFIRIGVKGNLKKPLLFTWLGGIALPVVFLLTFTGSWMGTRNEMDTIRWKWYEEENPELPLWAVYGQQVSDGLLTSWILQSEIRYQMENTDWFWGLDSRWSNKEKMHDPLFVVANAVGGDLPLSNLDAQRVIESRTSLKHASQRRLWSGSNLETTLVESETKVYPEYRLAYTEKKLVIKNNLPNLSEDVWQNGRQQEAVYTFHLPEGSVCTSLSLWINGVEEKARLSSKTLADSAYTSIVGVERRDPSLIHWQEGNTLVVTVFPCTPQEDRMFKIGITTPLRYAKDRLKLENIYFEGPTIAHAKEKTELYFHYNEPSEFVMPHKMEKLESGKYRYEGSYKPYWEFVFAAPELSPKAFSFNGQSYIAKPYEKAFESADIRNIYMDIDQSWDWQDFYKIWDNRGNRKVYIFNHRLIEVTEANKNELYDRLHDFRYSIFPLYLIPDSEHSLLVTGSSEYAPELDALKEEPFGDKLQKWAVNQKDPLKCFHVGGDLAPYLKSLREFRLLNYERGHVDRMVEMLNNNTFPTSIETDNRVVIHHSGMTIEKDSVALRVGGPPAPDHLARLFAYNDIMRRIGGSYLTDNYITQEVLSEAEKAFVVSPVSSLIVLETLEDYERFGIDENTNSLGNASMEDSGAVPEPHEWALILTVLLLLVLLYRKQLVAKFQFLRKK